MISNGRSIPIEVGVVPTTRKEGGRASNKKNANSAPAFRRSINQRAAPATISRPRRANHTSPAPYLHNNALIYSTSGRHLLSFRRSQSSTKKGLSAGIGVASHLTASQTQTGLSRSARVVKIRQSRRATRAARSNAEANTNYFFYKSERKVLISAASCREAQKSQTA